MEVCPGILSGQRSFKKSLQEGEEHVLIVVYIGLISSQIDMDFLPLMFRELVRLLFLAA